MKELIPDLAFEFLDDGTICLEQSIGYGETTLVVLHLSQLRLLCERAGLLKPPEANLAEHMTAGHRRRLSALYARIEELFHSDGFFNDLWDHCGDSAEWWMHLRAIYEQAYELVADLHPQAHKPDPIEREPVTKKACHEKSSDVISVTAGKRGRPTTGNAMSDAERQARHRANQKGTPPTPPTQLTLGNES